MSCLLFCLCPVFCSVRSVVTCCLLLSSSVIFVGYVLSVTVIICYFCLLCPVCYCHHLLFWVVMSCVLLCAVCCYVSYLCHLFLSFSMPCLLFLSVSVFLFPQSVGMCGCLYVPSVMSVFLPCVLCVCPVSLFCLDFHVR